MEHRALVAYERTDGRVTASEHDGGSESGGLLAAAMGDTDAAEEYQRDADSLPPDLSPTGARDSMQGRQVVAA